MLPYCTIALLHYCFLRLPLCKIRLPLYDIYCNATSIAMPHYCTIALLHYY